jgi:hypothetical protein
MAQEYDRALEEAYRTHTSFDAATQTGNREKSLAEVFRQIFRTFRQARADSPWRGGDRRGHEIPYRERNRINIIPGWSAWGEGVDVTIIVSIPLRNLATEIPREEGTYLQEVIAICNKEFSEKNCRLTSYNTEEATNRQFAKITGTLAIVGDRYDPSTKVSNLPAAVAGGAGLGSSEQAFTRMFEMQMQMIGLMQQQLLTQYDGYQRNFLLLTDLFNRSFSRLDQDEDRLNFLTEEAIEAAEALNRAIQSAREMTELYANHIESEEAALRVRLKEINAMSMKKIGIELPSDRFGTFVRNLVERFVGDLRKLIGIEKVSEFNIDFEPLLSGRINSQEARQHIEQLNLRLSSLGNDFNRARTEDNQRELNRINLQGQIILAERQLYTLYLSTLNS